MVRVRFNADGETCGFKLLYEGVRAAQRWGCMDGTVEAMVTGIGVRVVVSFDLAEVRQEAVVGPAVVVDGVAPEIVVGSIASNPGCVVSA